MTANDEPNASGNGTIYLTDLARCTPSSALARQPKPGHWRLMPYEAEGISGTLLGAGSLAQAPPVTLPLPVEGWCRIYLGIWDPIHAYDGPTLLKVKLTGEAAFRRISTAARRMPGSDRQAYREWQSCSLLECCWRTEDLTGKDLVIAQQTKAAHQQAYLAYVKLVPLTDKQVQTVARDRQQTNTRVVTVTNDGGSYYMTHHCDNQQDLLEQVELLRHSDVGKFVYALIHGDCANYPSRVGVSWSGGLKAQDITVSNNKRQLLQTFEALQQRQIDHVQVLRDHVKAMGIEFHAMARLGALGDLPPSQLWPDGIVRTMPEVRQVARNGTPMEKASYAFPAVRQRVAALIQEAVQEYDLDGVNLCFSRGPQFAAYEAPVVQDFKARHDIDPREADDDDVRLQQLRADYLTEFMRDVRRLVRQEEQRRGRALELSVWVCGDANDVDYQLFFNIDIRTWLAERLMDGVIAHKAPGPLLDEFRAANCEFHLYDDTAVTQESIDAFEQGRSQGFVKWDLDFEDAETWALTSRLGHPEEARALVKEPPLMQRVPLKNVNGCDLEQVCNVGAEQRGYWPPELLPVYTGG